MRPQPRLSDTELMRQAPARDEMYAAVVADHGRVELRRVPTPTPDRGMIRVRVEGCGVCASNIAPWEGRPWFQYPMPPGHLGHEGWGVIDAVGDEVSDQLVGLRVTMLSDNAYAQYDITSVEKAVALPESLAGRPFPGEPLGCAMNIFRRSGIKEGDTVAIVGAGFLGQLLTQLSARAGARVIAVSRRLFALDMARAFGADEVVAMDDHWKIINRVKEITGGRLCDVVVEAVGKQWPLDLAAELTRERGRLVIAGYHQEGPRQVNMQMWNWRGMDVINAHEREPQTYIDGIKSAIGEVTSGRLEPWPLFTHVYPLENLGEALEATRDRPDGFMKALINIQP